MSDRSTVILRPSATPRAAIPVCYRIVDTRLRTVEEGVLLLGASLSVRLNPGHYAVRLLMPSGSQTDGEYIRIGGLDGDSHGARTPQVLEYCVEPDETYLGPVHGPVAVPQQQLPWTAFQPAITLAPWARLWERHDGLWRVSAQSPSSLTSSATSTSISYDQLPSSVHLLQVGSAHTPWRFLRLPTGQRVDVTVQPADPSTPRLKIAVVGQDYGAHALLGYLAQGARRQADLLARHLARDDMTGPSSLRWAAIGYHLLRTAGSGLSDELFPHVLSARARHPQDTDLAVISAWHLLERMRSGVVEPSLEELAEAFLAAVRNLPTCTEGLRLLAEGLRLLDGRGHQAAVLHDALAHCGRYLAATDAASPLLAFHGEHPEAPGPAVTGRSATPDGAFLLVHPLFTGPVPLHGTAAPRERLDSSPGRDVRTLLKRLPSWRLRSEEWEEVIHALRDCATAIDGVRAPDFYSSAGECALTPSSAEELLASAVRRLRVCAAAQRAASGQAVPAPGAVRTQAHEILAALDSASVEEPEAAPAAASTAGAAPADSSGGKQQRDPATVNAESAELVNSAHDMRDPDLLHASIDMLRGLQRNPDQADPVRPVVLVNLGHALQELYRWTQTKALIEEAVECVAEAVALTPMDDPARERRQADLEAMQAMLRVGLTGKVPESAPRTSTAVGGTLELTFQSPRPTTWPARNQRLALGSGRPTPPKPSGPLPPDPDTPRPIPPESDDSDQHWAETQKTWRSLFRPPLRPLPRYDYEHYSRLAGPLTQPQPGIPYRVRRRSLLSAEPHRVRTALALALVPLISLCTLLWLLQPSHWQHQPTLWLVMLGCVGGIEGARLTSVFSCAHATLLAQDPVPVVPETGTRVAFLTTFVPGKEPLEMLSNTLRAAVRVRHRGLMHVWVLDEGNDPEVRRLCDQLGVHHFSRRGVAKWNNLRGVHKAKTKHGNYNAWLDAHGREYDFIAAVDTDHVPFPNFLERTLGYFRDPDIAFVVSPQVYGNYDSTVTKMAESQQFMFHALIQRVGNRHGSPMLVGTNLAVRTTALLQVGGFQDCITEDMLTGLAIHQRRHPDTGRHWRSVYTPDVLAVGEGPASWTDFVTQQLRWSRGTYETLLKDFWKAPFKLRLPSLVNYLFLLSWYPLLAISWILGGVSLALYFVGGASGGYIDPVVWAVLYGNAVALQLALYMWNRRHNVSPHEPVGSSGLAGMVMTLIIAPVYTRSLTDALLRRKSRFFVTPKGSSASPDRFVGTFRIHLFWAGTVTALAAYGISAHHTHPVMLIWATLTVAASLTPVVLWQCEIRRQRREWGFRRGAATARAAADVGDT